MKNKKYILICFFAFFMSFGVFAQSIRANDPFLGIWFAEADGTKFIHIYIDGIIVQLNNEDSETEIFNYRISGNELIVDNDEPVEFIVVNQNRIILEAEGITILLARQSGENMRQLIENYLSR